MKKFIAMMLCIIMILSLVACGKDEVEPTETTTEPTTETTEAPTTEEPTEEPTEETLPDEPVVSDEPIFQFITISEDGQYEPTESTEDMLLMKELHLTLPAEQRFGEYLVYYVNPADYESEVYFPHSEGFEAIICKSPISFQPQFVYLIKAPEGTDIDALRADIEAKADPYRTQCPPFVEHVVTAASGNTILFAMCQSPEVCQSLVDGFNSLMAD